jgi:hypothetical protein
MGTAGNTFSEKTFRTEYEHCHLCSDGRVPLLGVTPELRCVFPGGLLADSVTVLPHGRRGGASRAAPLSATRHSERARHNRDNRANSASASSTPRRPPYLGYSGE